MMLLAGVLCFLIGIIHSYFGEKYIIIRLLRRDNIPQLFGGTFFTKQTIRFAWHITTIAWWGFAYLLYSLSIAETDMKTDVVFTISVVFFISGLMALIFSKGKHLSWVVFWLISGLTYFSW